MNKESAVKEGAGGLLGVLATLGMTPTDVPLLMAIIIGLVGGTMAAWARERQNGKPVGFAWLVLRLSAWLMIGLLVLAIHDYPGISVRWAGALAALCAFASHEGLQALHKRTLREIEERKQ